MGGTPANWWKFVFRALNEAENANWIVPFQLLLVVLPEKKKFDNDTSKAMYD